ncbi:hypothetical protein TWF718_007356 [Orbilia javanica]|uniref:LysM domain-containing protein n=1 Tax=Orbilia javanica TaxID=47235 RepID=A0AAN8MRE4_9PEZI
MKIGFALVLLSQALSLVSGYGYQVCNADNCARQVTGTRHDQNQRRRDCTKYLVKTVVKGTSTKWKTTTKKKVTTKTVKKVVTKLVGKVTTVTSKKVATKTTTQWVTAFTTRTIRVTSGVVITTISPPVVTPTTTSPPEDTTTTSPPEDTTTTSPPEDTTTTSPPEDTTTTSPPEDTTTISPPDNATTTEPPVIPKRGLELEFEHGDILEARSGYYPSPVQPGMVKNCVGWRYIQGNDNCDNIVKRFSAAPIALSKANLFKWNPALKNGPGLKKGYYVCVRIDNMPLYISACNASRYTSACSCWGIRPGTKTVCGKTTTKTVTRTSTSTSTKTSTSTSTKTTTGTVTKWTTSTQTVVTKTTKTVVVDTTSHVPGSTSTVTSCPTGYIICGGKCINPLTNNDNCGACGVTCSSYCQAGACAGCVATTSLCEEGGGHLCDDESTCICTLNVEGQRTCTVSSNCEGQVCEKSSDCPSGWTCVPGTCCGNEPVCMRAPSGCPNGQHFKRIFKREPMPRGTISKRRILVPEFDLSWKLARMKNKV